MTRLSARANPVKDPNSLLLRCIDSGLDRYGQGVAQVVYFRLEHANNLPKEEIPKRLEDFVSALQDMFGSGMKSINRSIVAELKIGSGGLVEVDEDDLVLSLRLTKAHFQSSVV